MAKLSVLKNTQFKFLIIIYMNDTKYKHDDTNIYAEIFSISKENVGG